MKQLLLSIIAFNFITGCTLPLVTSSKGHDDGYTTINATYTVGRSGAVLRKYPKILTPILKNIPVGDTIFVHGRINHDWYVVRRNGKKYFAPYRDVYAFSVADITSRPRLDTATMQFIPVPVLAD